LEDCLVFSNEPNQNEILGGNIMASKDNSEDTTIYKVVVNGEEQYSIHPAHLDIPRGWKEVGEPGLKPECLEYVKKVWTDMRPLSLRKKMGESA
jgi:MbtH protein